MKVFVAGATGATGKWLVKFLLEQGHHVVVVVRSADRLPQEVRTHKNIQVTQAALLDLSDQELQTLTSGCDAITSCLGHNLTFKGMYGQPRLLVTDATRRLCQAVIANQEPRPVRYVLMNTTGNRNRDLNETYPIGEGIVIGIMRALLPPQRDNEKAADFLRTEIGQDHPSIEWVAVRPDGLVNQEKTSDYSLHQSPTRSVLFDAGITSRINVAHFMADLISNDALWAQWKGQMPVIYNRIQAD